MTSKVIDVFDRVAGEYDDVLPFFSSFAEELVALLPLDDGTRVLDLGAGRGAVTALALARGCRVTAVDAAPNMVARLAAEHGDEPGLDSVRVMDAHRLEFPDAAFDVVVASFVVHVLDDPAAALREVRRVLVPGGLVAFTHPAPPPGVDAPEPTDVLGSLFAEFSRYLPAGGGMGRPLDAAAVLADAGFLDCHVDAISVDIPVPDGETCWRWGLTHGSLAYFEDLPPQRCAEFRQRLVAEFDQNPAPNLRRTASLWQART